MLTGAASTFIDAHARIVAAGELAKARTSKREARMVTVPGLIALATLLYCVFHGYIVSGVILATIVGFGALCVA